MRSLFSFSLTAFPHPTCLFFAQSWRELPGERRTIRAFVLSLEGRSRYNCAFLCPLLALSASVRCTLASYEWSHSLLSVSLGSVCTGRHLEQVKSYTNVNLGDMDMLLLVTGVTSVLWQRSWSWLSERCKILLIAGLLTDNRDGFGCSSQHRVVIGVLR